MNMRRVVAAIAAIALPSATVATEPKLLPTSSVFPIAFEYTGTKAVSIVYNPWATQCPKDRAGRGNLESDESGTLWGGGEENCDYTITRITYPGSLTEFNAAVTKGDLYLGRAFDNARVHSVQIRTVYKISDYTREGEPIINRLARTVSAIPFRTDKPVVPPNENLVEITRNRIAHRSAVASDDTWWKILIALVAVGAAMPKSPQTQAGSGSGSEEVCGMYRDYSDLSSVTPKYSYQCQIGGHPAY